MGILEGRATTNLSFFNSPMKILIIGAGAVGGYFGAKLSKDGNDVSFFVRPQHKAILEKEGLRVKSFEGDFSVAAKVVTSVSEIKSPPDLVILATKCYDAIDAIKSVEPILGSSTIILTLLNGIGIEERLLESYGERVVPGIVVITARLASPGIIEHFARGFISIGELNRADGVETERVKNLLTLFKNAGVKAHFVSDMKTAKWKKLCWNAAFNPLSVIIENPIKVLLEPPEALTLIKGIIEEVRSVAKSEGVILEEEVIKETIDATYQLGDYHTSMWEDFNSGKPSELKWLNGEVVRIAKERNISAPYNETIVTLTELKFKNR